jgi:hypothetical protein
MEKAYVLLKYRESINRGQVDDFRVKSISLFSEYTWTIPIEDLLLLNISFRCSLYTHIRVSSPIMGNGKSHGMEPPHVHVKTPLCVKYGGPYDRDGNNDHGLLSREQRPRNQGIFWINNMQRSQGTMTEQLVEHSTHPKKPISIFYFLGTTWSFHCLNSTSIWKCCMCLPLFFPF